MTYKKVINGLSECDYLDIKFIVFMMFYFDVSVKFTIFYETYI